MADEQRPPDWWNTIDFRPAPPGWRVVYLHPGGRDVVPIAGWLIQERYTQTGNFPDDLADDLHADEQVCGRQRRVIPGYVSVEYGWTVWPIDKYEGGDAEIWHVLPPGAPKPDAADEQNERASRAHGYSGNSAGS